MWTIIAIEGIDRIGKSTFIETLKEKLHDVNECVSISIEKPTIGINTLKKIGYPLQDVSNIMEIRNIGLFEETLFQAQNTNEDKIIIRDRFNLSELAYGITYRKKEFDKLLSGIENPIDVYKSWNSWFEKELDKCAKIFLITFVLDRNSYPNEDEAISAKELVQVNEQFRIEHEKSVFKNKLLVELHKDPETGMTDIMDKLNDIMMFLTNYQWLEGFGMFYRRDRYSLNSSPDNFIIKIHDDFIVCIGISKDGENVEIGDLLVHKIKLYETVKSHYDEICSLYSDDKSYQEIKTAIINHISNVLIMENECASAKLLQSQPKSDNDDLPF